ARSCTWTARPAASTCSELFFEWLARLLPSVEAGRHHVHVRISKLHGAPGAAMARVSMFVLTVEDERGGLVRWQIRRLDVREVDPGRLRQMVFQILLLRIAVERIHVLLLELLRHLLDGKLANLGVDRGSRERRSEHQRERQSGPNHESLPFRIP